MGTLMQSEKRTARRKGLAAAAVAGGTVAAVVALHSILIGVVGLAGAGFLTWDWLRYRAKRGMYF